MPFTPILTGLGAVLAHIASTNYLFNNGRILGISTTFGDCLFSPSLESNVSVIVGMVIGTILAGPFLGLGLDSLPSITGPLEAGELALGKYTPLAAGALVGLGAYLASGCTSGHMLCGLPRLSKRSLAGTVTFFGVAVVTANMFTPVERAGLPVSCVDGSLAGCFDVSVGETVQRDKVIRYCLVVLAAGLGSYGIGRCGKHIISSAESKLSIGEKGNSLKRLRMLSSAYSGFLFSLALIMSGMADRRKVMGFFLLFPVDGKWRYFDPSLLMVMAFGVVPNLIVWQKRLAFCRPPRTPILENGSTNEGPTERDPLIKGGCKGSPALCKEFQCPPSTAPITGKLIIGSAIFGLGWGLLGFCPGPGVIAAVRTGIKGLGAKELGANWWIGEWGWVAGFFLGRGFGIYGGL